MAVLGLVANGHAFTPDASKRECNTVTDGTFPGYIINKKYQNVKRLIEHNTRVMLGRILESSQELRGSGGVDCSLDGTWFASSLSGLVTC